MWANAKKDNLKMKNTWVSFLSVSLKMRVDLIAGRQINQNWKKSWWF